MPPHSNPTLIDSADLQKHLQYSPLAEWGQTLPEQLKNTFNRERYGDLPAWLNLLASLPKIRTTALELNADAIGIGHNNTLPTTVRAEIKRCLLALSPWRKGPFNLFGIDIDAEWRSYLKWNRIAPHIDLNNKNILDIGCGNGYYALRMLGQGAKFVLGIDPNPRCVLQYSAIKHFIENPIPFCLLPIGIEHLPTQLHWFDTVFSMGVLYHRRSPIDHLIELKHTLRPGGQLILETLVIEGSSREVLVPEKRYAMMPNVWFIPSSQALTQWLYRAGFQHVKLIDVSQTTVAEQRSTEWMSYHSLSHFLDPENPEKTIEGYPAPTRALFIATVSDLGQS